MKKRHRSSWIFLWLAVFIALPTLTGNSVVSDNAAAQPQRHDRDKGTFLQGDDELVRCNTFVARQGTHPKLDYCLTLPGDFETNRSADVFILYLHGLGGNERSWNTYALTQQVASEFKRLGMRTIVLSPSFGNVWFLKETPSDSKRNSKALLPLIADELVDHVKLHLNLDLPTVVWGTSMGGFNGMMLYLKRPERWKAVVLGSPALVAVNPFDDPKGSLKDYVRRTRAWPSKASVLLQVSKGLFNNVGDYWDHNPFALIPNLVEEPSVFPPLYLACGIEDHFGFQEGTILANYLLMLRGNRRDFDLLPGGGGVFDHVVIHVKNAVNFTLRVAVDPATLARASLSP